MLSIKTRLMILITMLAMLVWEQVLHGRLQPEVVPQNKKMSSTHAEVSLQTVVTDMNKTVKAVAQGGTVRDQV